MTAFYNKCVLLLTHIAMYVNFKFKELAFVVNKE